LGAVVAFVMAASAASHWLAALAAMTKATTAPNRARTFHPPCQRGREGRTYPGGAVVPLFMVDLLAVVNCTFHY